MRRILIFSFTLLYACSLKKERPASLDNFTQDLKMVYKTFVNKEIEGNVKAILIIPFENLCDHCRDKAIDYAKEYINYKNLRIVFTSNEHSQKKRFAITDFHVAADTMAYICEKSDLMFSKNLVSVNPVVYYLEKSQVVSYTILDASNIDKGLLELTQVIQ